MYPCLDGCDALVVMTEWREFQRPNFEEIACRLKAAVIFDGRNLFDKEAVLRAGFSYHAVGRALPG